MRAERVPFIASVRSSFKSETHERHNDETVCFPRMIQPSNMNVTSNSYVVISMQVAYPRATRISELYLRTEETSTPLSAM